MPHFVPRLAGLSQGFHPAQWRFDECNLQKLPPCVCRLDVDFLIDTTQSMVDVLDDMITQVDSYVDWIVENSPSFQLGGIEFKDDVTIGVRKTPNNDGEFREWVNGLFAAGGAGEPEASDIALWASVDGDAGVWRDNSQKIIILITDARPGGFDEDPVAGEANAVAAAEAGFERGIITNVILTGDYHPDAPRIWRRVADAGGGAFVISQDDQASEAILAILQQSCPPIEEQNPIEGCCNNVPCHLCLTWTPDGAYEPTNGARLVWNGECYSGDFLGTMWSLCWIDRGDGDCALELRQNGYPIATFPKCDAYGQIINPCTSPEGMVATEINEQVGVLEFFAEKSIVLADFLDEYNCKVDQFCGNCTCVPEELCVTGSKDEVCFGREIIGFSGEFCRDTSVAITAEWSGSVTLRCEDGPDIELEVQIFLQRDEDTGDCIIAAGVQGDHVGSGSVVVSDCFSGFLTIDVGDGYRLTVSPTICDACVLEECLGCCLDVDPYTLELPYCIDFSDCPDLEYEPECMALTAGEVEKVPGGYCGIWSGGFHFVPAPTEPGEDEPCMCKSSSGYFDLPCPPPEIYIAFVCGVENGAFFAPELFEDLPPFNPGQPQECKDVFLIVSTQPDFAPGATCVLRPDGCTCEGGGSFVFTLCSEIFQDEERQCPCDFGGFVLTI